MKKTFLAFGIAISLISCNNNNAKITPNDTLAISSSKDGVIRNDIATITKGGLKVEQAFMLQSDGALLPNDNIVKVGEPVEMRIRITGWKGDSTGNISLGASEKITTSEGNAVLDEADLFAKQPAIPVLKADLLRVQAVVTKQNKEYDYYQVSFKVWNKGANQSVEGSYKLHIK